jgi:uncharacterized membrane protein YadS
VGRQLDSRNRAGVAAAYQAGTRAGDPVTIAKLTRVMMLAPVVLSLGLLARSRGSEARARVPMRWFVLGFLVLIGINSLLPIPTAIKSSVGITTTCGLSIALAAMGLETSVRELRAKGLQPFLLELIAFFLISGFSLL